MADAKWRVFWFSTDNPEGKEVLSTDSPTQEDAMKRAEMILDIDFVLKVRVELVEEGEDGMDG